MVAILVSLIFPTSPPLAASMVIDRPEATGASPVRAGAKRRMAVEDFLGFPRGMPALAGRGRKSGNAVEAMPVEAQPAFGPIKPLRGRMGADLLAGAQGDMATTGSWKPLLELAARFGVLVQPDSYRLSGHVAMDHVPSPGSC
ncbi:MAG: hypothetical protein ABS75_31915 [Pelagibacterium sp. SCN 63-23]|nr:MAG: hypothetical protein ABS75_31915 [Pelagibacterium sp. SCN 63-23]